MRRPRLAGEQSKGTEVHSWGAYITPGRNEQSLKSTPSEKKLKLFIVAPGRCNWG